MCRIIHTYLLSPQLSLSLACVLLLSTHTHTILSKYAHCLSPSLTPQHIYTGQSLQFLGLPSFSPIHIQHSATHFYWVQPSRFHHLLQTVSSSSTLMPTAPSSLPSCPTTTPAGASCASSYATGPLCCSLSQHPYPCLSGSVPLSMPACMLTQTDTHRVLSVSHHLCHPVALISQCSWVLHVQKHV